jgi:hypothetical protein
MQDLKDQGYTGQLGPEYNVNTNLPGNGGEGVDGQDSDPQPSPTTGENQ